MDKSVQVSEPNHHFHHCPVQIQPVIFNNVDFTNVITNSNDKEITIPPVYYSIGEIIAIPNPMTHTRFLIFSIASSGECIWIQFPHTINCTNASRYTWNFQSGRMYGHSSCFVLWVERDWFHFKSPSDPSVFIVGPILRSEDCEPEQQPTHHDNHWWSNCWLHPHHGGYLQTMISRFGWLMFLFRDMEDNIMQLNGLFELQLTIEDVYDQVPFSIPPMNQVSMTEVFGNTMKKEVKLDNPLSHSINIPSRQCHSIPISCCTMCLPIKW